MTKVLMISSDAKILEEGSPVRARMAEYGTLFAETNIILFTLANKAGVTTGGRRTVQVSPNVFVHPTDSFSRFFYITDAIALGQKVIRGKGLAKGDCIITAQDPFEAGMVGRMLSQKSGIPLHVQIHTDFQSAYFRKGILNMIRIGFSKIVFPQAKAVRAVSDKILASLPAQVRSKASVLPIYADVASVSGSQVTADLRKKYPRFGKIALAASRLTKEKDIASAIRAFVAVRKNLPDAGLVIVGSGAEEANLKALAAAAGLADSVIFEPWADHATLVSYMKTCDAFISASLYEGYGLSMLEAHAAGATLVATNAGIAPLLADESCLIAPGDVSALAAAIECALSGEAKNKPYRYPYQSKSAYLDVYRADIERAK
ncbi:MAG TPA: glycosyltransferase [Candidatus Paceibacterota bacterium]